MNARAVVVIGVCAAVVVGCLFPGLGGLEGPGDAGAASDGAADGGQEGGFCASAGQHTLCLDFDESTAVAQYGQLNTNGGAMLTVDGTSWTSPPQALSVSVLSGAYGSAHVDNTFPVVPGKLTASFQLQDVAAGNGPKLKPLTVSFSNNGTIRYQVAVEAYKTSLKVEEGFVGTDAGTPYVEKGTYPITWDPTKYYRIDLDITFGTTRSLTVNVNGALAIAATLDARAFAAPVTIQVGTTYSDPDTTMRNLRIDDVLFDVSP